MLGYLILVLSQVARPIGRIVADQPLAHPPIASVQRAASAGQTGAVAGPSTASGHPYSTRIPEPPVLPTTINRFRLFGLADDEAATEAPTPRQETGQRRMKRPKSAPHLSKTRVTRICSIKRNDSVTRLANVKVTTTDQILDDGLQPNKELSRPAQRRRVTDSLAVTPQSAGPSSSGRLIRIIVLPLQVSH